MDRARPEAVKMAERVLGVIEPQVHAEILMLEVKLAAVAVIAHP